MKGRNVAAICSVWRQKIYVDSISVTVESNIYVGQSLASENWLQCNFRLWCGCWWPSILINSEKALWVCLRFPTISAVILIVHQRHAASVEIMENSFFNGKHFVCISRPPLVSTEFRWNVNFPWNCQFENCLSRRTATRSPFVPFQFDPLLQHTRPLLNCYSIGNGIGSGVNLKMYFVACGMKTIYVWTAIDGTEIAGWSGR